LVEADGEQHYQEGPDTYFDTKNLKEHDRRKNEYAKENGLKLIRIRYRATFAEVRELVCLKLAPLISND